MTKWRYSIPAHLLKNTTNIALSSLLGAENGITGEFDASKPGDEMRQFSKDFFRETHIQFDGFSPMDYGGFLPTELYGFCRYKSQFDNFLQDANYSKHVYQAWNQELGHSVGKIFTGALGVETQDPENGPTYVTNKYSFWPETLETPAEKIRVLYNHTSDQRLITTQQLGHILFKYRFKNPLYNHFTRFNPFQSEFYYSPWQSKKLAPIAIEYKSHQDKIERPYFKPTYIHASNREQLGATTGETYRPQFFRRPDVIRKLTELPYTITQLLPEYDGESELKKGIHFRKYPGKNIITATIKNSSGKSQSFPISRELVNTTLDTLIQQDFFKRLKTDWQPENFCIQLLVNHLRNPANNLLAQVTLDGLTANCDVNTLHAAPSATTPNNIYFYPGENQQLHATIVVNNGDTITLPITDEILKEISRTSYTNLLASELSAEQKAPNAELSNNIANLAFYRLSNNYFDRLIAQWPTTNTESNIYSDFNQARGNIVLRTLAAHIKDNFKYSAPDSISLPTSFYLKNNFRYVFKEEDGVYSWNPINILMFIPKFIAEYIPLVFADLSLLALDNYRKQPWRHSTHWLPCLVIDIIPFVLLSTIHYTSKILYWFGRTLTSPVESYQDNRAIHPKLGILMGALSLISTVGLSVILGLFVAPLLAPHCVMHVASTNILARLGSFLSIFTQALGCASQCALSALTALSSFVLFFIINPIYTLQKNAVRAQQAEQKKIINKDIYKKIVRDPMVSDLTERNEALASRPAIMARTP